MQGLPDLLRLWYHENCRVFQDRLVSNEDREWFDELLRYKMLSDFDIQFDEVVTKQPVLFADFLGRTVDSRNYEEITDNKKVGNFLCL